MKEETKEMKLADVFKEVTVQSEFETFWNDFGDEIESFMGATVEIMQATAEKGEDFIDVDLSELSLGAYQYVLNWLKSEGFKVTEKREYKSDELKGMVSNVVISWAHAKGDPSKQTDAISAVKVAVSELHSVGVEDNLSAKWGTVAGSTANDIGYVSGTDGLLSAKIADCATTAYATAALSSCW